MNPTDPRFDPRWAAPQQQPARKKLGGFAKGVVGFVVTGLVGTVVISGIWGDEILNRWSNRKPLDVHVSVQPTRPATSFDMVVPNAGDMSGRLGPRPAPGEDCDRLWKVGVEAGGMPISETGYSIVLHGNAREGVVITDMRAVMTRTLPAVDGALLYCPIQAGGTSALALAFSLTTDPEDPIKTDRAEYMGESGWTPRFDDGYVVTVAKDEAVPLDVAVVSTGIERDGFAWHIEADAIVGGERRTLVIDNGGKDFVNPGKRAEYPAAYGGGWQMGGDWQTVVTSSELRTLPAPQFR